MHRRTFTDAHVALLFAHELPGPAAHHLDREVNCHYAPPTLERMGHDRG